MPITLFRIDLYRVDPEHYDAACREFENRLKTRPRYAELPFAKARAVVSEAVALKYPWPAQRCGWLEVRLEADAYFADLHLGDSEAEVRSKPVDCGYRESLPLGGLNDAPEAIREILTRLPDKLELMVAAGVYVDREPYEILIERFDFKRFAADHRLPVHAGERADRARRWN